MQMKINKIGEIIYKSYVDKGLTFRIHKELENQIKQLNLTTKKMAKRFGHFVKDDTQMVNTWKDVKHH